MAQSPSTPVQAGPTTPCHSHGHSSCHSGHQCSPQPTHTCPVLVDAGPSAPRVPHNPRVPSSPIFCAKILSNVTSPRSSRYFCMTLRMLGTHRRGSAVPPDGSLLPTPPLLLLPCPQTPVACTSYHPACPHPSVAHCWVPGSQRDPHPGAQGRVGMSVPPKKLHR